MTARLADRLAAARRNCGLTQQAAAHAIGKSHASISAYETGYATPPLDTLQRLAALYGATVAQLIDEDTMTDIAPAGWPTIRAGGYACIDPEHKGKPPRLAYFTQSLRVSSAPQPWPRAARGRTGAENRDYMRRVARAIAEDPVKARAYFAAFQLRCAVCCQPLQDEAHISAGMHSGCEGGRVGWQRAQAYRDHVQLARQLVAAGELDPGPSPAAPPTINTSRAAYVR